MILRTKYHPTKPCADCGLTKRIVALGKCCACYHAYRQSQDATYTLRRRTYHRDYARKQQREYGTTDPVRAIRILTAAFEAWDVDIDDLIWWIHESRRRNVLGGSHSERRPTRHYTSQMKRSQLKHA